MWHCLLLESAAHYHRYLEYCQTLEGLKKIDMREDGRPGFDTVTTMNNLAELLQARACCKLSVTSSSVVMNTCSEVYGVRGEG